MFDLDRELTGSGQSQSQISNIIEPIAEELIPIAEELEDVYAQIDLLEVCLLVLLDLVYGDN